LVDFALVSLMTFVAVGFKARLAALVLALGLAICNVKTNAWWTLEDDDPSAVSNKTALFQVRLDSMDFI
jgi:uncharacterized membrane protein YphA (DoxX/SURF4 family)